MPTRFARSRSPLKVGPPFFSVGRPCGLAQKEEMSLWDRFSLGELDFGKDFFLTTKIGICYGLQKDEEKEK